MNLIVHVVTFITVTFLVYWFVAPAKWRSVVLFIASAYVMSLFSVKYTAYFTFNALIIYLAGTYISKKNKNAKLLLKLSLIWLIGSLSVFKYAHIFLNPIIKASSELSHVPEISFTQLALPVGISYIIFRLIHYIVEIYRNSLPKHTFWDLAAYVFFFPTFIAGPVDRFQKVQPQIEKQNSIDPSDINYGLFRITVGLIKKFIVADALSPIIIPVLTAPERSSPMIVLLSVYGLAIQIYMDFSGYTDMALGISRLFGFKIMENFHYPFFQKNIALFWRNWHMSVYTFIRDYFYIPFFAFRASRLKMYVGLVVTLIVFALWHELSIRFLALGLYLGLGMVVWQWSQELKVKHREIHRALDNRFSDVVSCVITFNYVSLGMLVFYVEIEGIKNIMLHILL